jgi:hypothetical protein
MYTKWPEKYVYPMAVIYSKYPKAIPTFSIPIYPILDFGFENIPSGNPVESRRQGPETLFSKSAL